MMTNRSRRAHVVALGSAIFVMVALPALLSGQRVEVRVRENTTATPVAGALVSLVSSAGGTVAEGLTTAAGTRMLVAPATGEYRVRVRRIGYAQFVSGVTSVLSGDQVVVLSVPSARIRLDTVTVVSTAKQCKRADAESVRSSQLWETIGSALAVSRYSRADTQSITTFSTYERMLDKKFKVLETRQFTHKSSEASPFDARDPAELSAHGYLARESGRTLLFGPDERVLLSDEFLTDHCFTAVAANDSALIGLGFVPVEARSVVDIAGTILVDTASAELRSVQYHYVHLPWGVSEDSLGGRVEFAHGANGGWMVTTWAIRVPRFEASLLGGRLTFSAVGYAETGGQVALDDASHQAGSGGFRNRVIGVFDATSGDPIRGARVSDTLTGAFATTTETGTIGLGFLPTGLSALRVQKSGFEDFLVQVSISPGDTTPITIVLAKPSRGDASRQPLPGAAGGPVTTKPNSGRVLTVRDSLTNSPLAGVDVVDVVGGGITKTSDSGNVSLAFLPAGGSLVRVRKVGYAPQTFIVATSPVDTASMTVLLSRVTELPAVIVRDSTPHYISPALRGFQERYEWGKKTGFGHFINESQLRSAQGRRLIDVLTQHTNIHIPLTEAITCPEVFVDGIRGGAPVVLKELRGGTVRSYFLGNIGVDEFAGIEYYARAGEIPPAFNTTGNGCGVLLLWTRER